MNLYTREDLNAMSVHTLRVVLRTDFKGVPGVMNKAELIDKILSIQSGEKPPVRSTKGRKPLGEFLTPADIELHLSDFEGVDGDVPQSVKGVLELHAEGYGFIRLGGLDITPSDVYVSKTLIKKFSLKSGDEVEGDCAQMRDSGVVTLKSVKSVNGGANFEQKRVDFSTFTPNYPNKKIILYNGENPALGLIDLFSPLGEGQRCLVLDQTGRRKTEFLKDLISSLVKSGKKVCLTSVCSKPEDVTAYKQSGVSVVEISSDCQPQKIVRKAILSVEVLKRQLEIGNSSVLILTDVNSVISAYEDCALTDKIDQGFLSDGLTARSVAKKILNCAGCYGERGSLTVIGVLKSDLKDREYSDLFDVATSVITLAGNPRKRRGYSVDPVNSFTDGDENLLTAKEIEKADSYRAKLAENPDFMDEILAEITR